MARACGACLERSDLIIEAQQVAQFVGALQQTGLRKTIDREGDGLAGGQRQRLA